MTTTRYVSFADAMRAQAGALVKSDVAIAKSAPRSRSRADWFAAIRKHAEGMRRPGQSIQQAVTVFISKGDGQVLHKAMSLASGPSYIVDKMSDAPTTQADEIGDGPEADDRDSDAPSFSDLVDQFAASHSTMSRSACIDRVLASNEGRKAMKIEKARVRKRRRQSRTRSQRVGR
jgi:hypothetical protein